MQTYNYLRFGSHGRRGEPQSLRQSSMHLWSSHRWASHVFQAIMQTYDYLRFGTHGRGGWPQSLRQSSLHFGALTLGIPCISSDTQWAQGYYVRIGTLLQSKL
jgi:hypothetical protein